MKCQYCDNEIPVGSATCPSCGAAAPVMSTQATPNQQNAVMQTDSYGGEQQQAVSFGEAVKRFWTKWSFKGRASRSEFWFAILAYCIFSGVLEAIDEDIGSLFNLVALWPLLCVSARRLHDVGKSGWWQIVPIVNLVYWTQPSYPKNNAFGPVPNVK